eukprot:3721048-Rhodomonas_salina.2
MRKPNRVEGVPIESDKLDQVCAPYTQAQVRLTGRYSPKALHDSVHPNGGPPLSAGRTQSI